MILSRTSPSMDGRLTTSEESLYLKRDLRTLLLSQQIISWVEKQFNSENVLDLWIFAKRFLIAKLEVVCWKFLMKHFNEIKTHKLQALEREDLLSLLTSDDLRMGEESVWELVEKLTGPNDDGTLIRECVRYGLLEDSFLAQRVFTSSKFQRYFSSNPPIESLSGMKPRKPTNLVFLFGGFRSQQQHPSSTMSVLDPSTGVFGHLPVSFPTGYAYSGAVVDQSTIYIAGGHLEGQGPINCLFKLNLDDLSLCQLSNF